MANQPVGPSAGAKVSRLFACGTAGLMLGLCLGFASCGEPPAEDEEATEQGLGHCNDVCKKVEGKVVDCQARCVTENGEGGEKVSLCAFEADCGDKNGGFETEGEEGRKPGGSSGTGNSPRRPNCSIAANRGCHAVGNRYLVGQYTNMKCRTFLTWRGLKQECWNEIYDVYNYDQDSNDCEYCPCRVETVKRCNRGDLAGGNWGARGCHTRSGSDRARCW